MDIADLNDYRKGLRAMPDERLVLELVTIHYNYIRGAPDLLDYYNAVKEHVLARMDYEAGRKK